MHDPMVVAFTIVRPFPSRSELSAGGKPGARWQMRLYHSCGPYCGADDMREEAEAHHGYPNRRQRRTGMPCGGPHVFDWWKPASYSRFWVVAGHRIYWPALVTIWHTEPGGHDALTICRQRRQDDAGKWIYSRSWRWHVHHWRIQVHPAQNLRRWLLTRCEWCGGKSRRGDYVNVSHSWHPERPRRWWHGRPGLYHLDCSSIAHAQRLCSCAVPVVKDGRSYGDCLICGKFRRHGAPMNDAELALAALPRGSRMTDEVRAFCEPIWAEHRARERQTASD